MSGDLSKGLVRPQAGDHPLARVATVRALQQRDAGAPVLANRMNRPQRPAASRARSLDGARSRITVVTWLHRTSPLAGIQATAVPGTKVRIDGEIGDGAPAWPVRTSCNFYKWRAAQTGVTLQRREVDHEKACDEPGAQ